MTDLISRLYRYGKELEVCNEAADEIERLRADAERYRWLRANMTGVIQLMGRVVELFWRDLGPNAELSGHQRPARKDEK